MISIENAARQVRDAPPTIKARLSKSFIRHMEAAAERYDYIDQAIADGRVQLIDGSLMMNGNHVSIAVALILLSDQAAA